MPDSQEYDAYVNELIRTQTAEGYWTSACDGGPAMTAKALVALRFAEQIDKIETATLVSIVKALCEGQNKDGSFNPWATSEVAKPGPQDHGAIRSATAAVIAGIKASGVRPGEIVDVDIEQVTRKAEQFIRDDRSALGDNDDGSAKWLYQRVIDRGKEGDYTALYLAMARVIDVKDLPPTPIVFRLVPGSEVVLAQRVNLLLPLQLLAYDVIVQYLRNGRRPPARPDLKVPDIKAFTSSVVSASRETMLPDLKVRAGKAVSSLFDSAALALRGWRDVTSSGPTLVEGERLKALLARYRNQDGSWLYGDSITTSLSVAALHAVGTSATDSRIVEAVSWLTRLIGDGDFIPLFSADVWITAFRVRALIAHGLKPWNSPLLRSVKWLTSVQRNGSWAFQAGNTALPDMDDTSMALAALVIAYNAERAECAEQAAGDGFGSTLRGEIENAIMAGRAYLLARQNADGGWASFQSGLPSKPAGAFLTGPPPMPKDSVLARWDFLLNPPPELGDPAVEDVTGRVLFALGNAGMRAYEGPIARAIEFLKRNQLESGAFWGRWTVAYVPATAWVLRGLAAVHADLTEPWASAAIKFLESHRNGAGWGEDIAAVRSPALAGQGIPTRFHTATALSALVEMPNATLSDAVDKGRVSLGAFKPKDERGRHSDPNTVVHPLVPPDSFYTIPGLDHDIAVEAMGLHARLTQTEALPLTPAVKRHLVAVPRKNSVAWQVVTRDRLDSMLKEGDEPVEKLLSSLGENGRAAVLFQKLAAIDDAPAPNVVENNEQGKLVPLRDAVGSQLDEFIKTAGADLADDKEKRDNNRNIASNLFKEAGWAIGTALFCSSLPQCFACSKGAVVLFDTGRFDHAPERRIIETTQFVFDVATGSAEVTKLSAIRVRFMHEIVRRERLLTMKHDPKDLGTPINQQHLLLTMLSFSTMVTDGLRSMGLNVTDEQETAWLGVWREVGCYLGIKKENLALVDTPAHAQSTLQQLRAAAWDTSNAGTELGKSLIGLLQSFVPSGVFSGLPVAMIRHMAGDRCADLLEMDPADWTALLVDVEAKLTESATDLFARTPIQYVARAVSSHVLQGLANRPRQGKPSAFRIPADFVEEWQRTLRSQRLA